MKETFTLEKSAINEIISGLRCTPKHLPSKYFYDEEGSKLFDKITLLDEYYLTRTEKKILNDNLAEFEQLLGDEIELIEPGSGSSEKTRILLDHLTNIKRYIPIDISGDYLFSVADQLRVEYPDITIDPLSVDYTYPFELPNTSSKAQKIVFFPGSTIGNFQLSKIQRFLSILSTIIGKKGGVLIGVDLKKDVATLEEAYNDSRGVTAAFNKNMLLHLNTIINTDFDIDNYTHKAVWVEEKGAVEMRLYSKVNHAITVNGLKNKKKKGEYLHTENSHKYSLDEFSSLVSPWFEVKKVWVDDHKLFSVQYMIPRH